MTALTRLARWRTDAELVRRRKREALTCTKWMSSCHPKTAHALVQTQCFPGSLLDCVSIVMQRKTENMSQSVHLWSSWKHLFVQRRESCPTCPRSQSCTYTFGRFGDAAVGFHRWLCCGHAGPCWGLTTLLSCWFLLRDRSTSVISNIHKEFSLQAYKFKTAKPSVRHALSPSWEG